MINKIFSFYTGTSSNNKKYIAYIYTVLILAVIILSILNKFYFELFQQLCNKYVYYIHFRDQENEA